MDFVCKNKRLRLKFNLVFKDMQETQEMGYTPWEELVNILPKPCGDPQGKHCFCRDVKACSLCKLKEDDRKYNPQLVEAYAWKPISQGLHALIRLQEECSWLVDSPTQTMQNLFNLSAEGRFSKADKATLQNWGYVLYRPEHAKAIRSNPAEFAFVEHEALVQGTKTHLFCIQHDPGNARYAYMADDIWNITHAGYTRPNPVSIGNVIETLLSLWCLAPVFAQLVGKLDMELIKSHTRAWTEDIIATIPSPKPKPKISLSKEELEEAGLAVSSDEEDF